MPRLILILLAAVLAVHVFVPLTEASVFEVDRFDDPFPAQTCASGVAVDCSLREAVITANNTAGPDIIIVPAGTYTLTRAGAAEDAAVSGDLDVTEAARFEGAGMALTVIDGGGPGVLDDRIIDIHGVEVEIDGVTITGGSGVTSAGGVNSRPGSMLTLTYTMITANQADNTAGWAGGMQTAGMCTISNSVIHDNSASRAGGIDASGTTTIQDSRITDNRSLGAADWQGGGILSFGAGSTTRLIRTVVSGNTSQNLGGGLHAWGPVEIEDSTFENNHAGKFGGGISIPAFRTVTIKRSSFYRNTTDGAGSAIGVETDGTLDINNSTFDKNVAGEDAAIAVEGTAWLTNVTISRNEARGATAVITSPTSSFTIGNTILEGSCTLGVQPTSLGGNIESPGSTCMLKEATDQSEVKPLNLDLGPLGYFGGYSATRLLRPGSVAIDTANGCPASLEDQRGVTRPIDGDGVGGAACDVGAAEVLLDEYPWLFADGFETGDTFGWSSSNP
jgi:hypothetical protein